MKFLKPLILTILLGSLSACASFGPGKSNLPAPTPLKPFKQQLALVKVWDKNITAGSHGQNVVLTPVIDKNTIFVPGYDGHIVAIRATTDPKTGVIAGEKVGDIYTKQNLTTGMAARDNTLFVGSGNATLIAVNELDGKIKWQVPLKAVPLATPATSKSLVIIKTQDSSVTAYSIKDGKQVWTYQDSTTPKPAIMLRKASSPVVYRGFVYAGFASGNVVKLNLSNGNLISEGQVDSRTGLDPIQEMVDIAATPVIANDSVVVGTYQGKLAAIRLSDFKPAWESKFSIVNQITTNAAAKSAASKTVYVADTKDNIYAINAKTSDVLWLQKALNYRNLSGLTFATEVPGLDTRGGILLTADAEGIVHVLSAQTGMFLARAGTDTDGISAPILVDGNNVYAYTNDGNLYAFKLERLNNNNTKSL